MVLALESGRLDQIRSHRIVIASQQFANNDTALPPAF